RKKLARARGFEFHQANEPLVVLSISQFGLGIVATGQILLWQINSASLQIFADITNNVRHLQSESELEGIFFAARVAISKDLDTAQPHGAGHPLQTNTNIRERSILESPQSLPSAGDDSPKHLG